MMLTLNPHKVFYVNGNHYLYIAKTGAIFQLDDATLRLIALNGKNMEDASREMENEFGMSQEKFSDILKEFRDVRLMGLVDEDKDWEFSPSHLHGIELMVCQCCNLACKYCYATEGEYSNPGWMTEDVGKKAIDFLFRHATQQFLRVSFFGGEPLLNFKLIATLVEYAKTVADSCGKTVSFAVTTNGTLIDDKIAEFLTKNKFYISLSVDGTRENHNTCRINKTGTGSYDESIKMLPSLSKNQITLRATSTPENCNYPEISNALYDLTKNEYFIAEAMNCFTTDDSLLKIEQSYDLLIKKFQDDLLDGDVRKCRANMVIYNNLKRIAHFEERSCHCSAFIHGIAININGDIFPCHRFVGTDYSIGNVHSTEFENDLATIAFNRDFMFKNRIGCSSCWAQNLCVGGCPYLNLEATGSCQIPSPARCRLTRYLLEKVIPLYLSLTDAQKKALDL